jgi:hypothetical protein
MSLRPLSVVSDLTEALKLLCDEALECGLEPDLIMGIVKKTSEEWEAECEFEYDE